MKVYYGCLLISLLIAVAATQQGCTWGAGATGWRFEVGIAPVQQLNNQAGLKQLDSKTEMTN